MAEAADEAAVVAASAAAAHPLTGAMQDLAPLLDAIGEAQFVLLGENTHGTKEFYELRSTITRALIENKGFTVVLVEADWPATSRLNRYISNQGSMDQSVHDALADFEAFPRWMWRNNVIAQLAEDLRAHNCRRVGEAEMSEGIECGKWACKRCTFQEDIACFTCQLCGAPRMEGPSVNGHGAVSFYGMDLYSVHASARTVVEFLEIVDPDAAVRAQSHYALLDSFGTSGLHQYGRQVAFGGELSHMADEITNGLSSTLADVQRGNREEYATMLGPAELLDAEQSAQVVVNGEAYFRGLHEDGSVTSWNLRDQHMVATCMRLVEFHALHSADAGAPKIVIWAHNSHCGDASATELGVRDEWNLGQMLRASYGADNVFICGFGASCTARCSA